MSPTSRLEASQLAYATAAQLRAWAAHSKGAPGHLRRLALVRAETLELFTAMLDPDAIFESGRPTSMVSTLTPWLLEVGNDDPTPVDFATRAREKK